MTRAFEPRIPTPWPMPPPRTPDGRRAGPRMVTGRRPLACPGVPWCASTPECSPASNTETGITVTNSPRAASCSASPLPASPGITPSRSGAPRSASATSSGEASTAPWASSTAPAPSRIAGPALAAPAHPRLPARPSRRELARHRSGEAAVLLRPRIRRRGAAATPPRGPRLSPRHPEPHRRRGRQSAFRLP